ncbi:sel1 repeat family protein [Pseudoxanthomonas sp. LH2527]|uniref:tetratricopeptide repeat protein n=1 Tax=Pseudoxanthomonas sp. LH2527 TaxID=2923249 RepID=UPI001F13BB8B|nr:sel1 repeat family protein [Pseudoxanthomonas sp. LH2527]MCH6485030.1 sel1 repeat family protein [Pseudoxanthomonas sp. LH2527]
MLISASLFFFALASTSSDFAEREDQLSPKKCATTLKRAENFVKYWPPGSSDAYIMYNPDKMGFRAYDLLGDLHFRGCEKAALSPNKVEAARWYQSAAVKHLPESQWKLGKMFYEGDGVAQDKEAGLAWLTSAAMEGSAEAAVFLQRAGEKVPTAVTPNSYSVAMEHAKNELARGQAADRDRMVRDLARFLVDTATVYAVAKAAQPVVVSPSKTTIPAAPAAPTIRAVGTQPLTMTKPVYCSHFVSGSSVGDTVYVSVSGFCN